MSNPASPLLKPQRLQLQMLLSRRRQTAPAATCWAAPRGTATRGTAGTPLRGGPGREGGETGTAWGPGAGAGGCRRASGASRRTPKPRSVGGAVLHRCNGPHVLTRPLLESDARTGTALRGCWGRVVALHVPSEPAVYLATALQRFTVLL